MNKSILHIQAVETAAAVLLAALALNSCTNGGLTPPETDSAEPVRISAEVSGELYSRAGYQDQGLVTDGEYYLAYPLNVSGDNLSWTVAVADFGKDGNGLGIVTTPQGNELKWSDVGGGSVPTFSLDNVPPGLDRNNNTDPTTVVFGDENPFVAAPFDDKYGSNDLLWGNKQVNRDTRRIDFDLHHYMSRVRLVITADETNSQEGALDLNGATVSISSLVLTPVSFNRLDGSLSLGDDPGRYKTLEFVNDEINWDPEKTKPDKDNDKKIIYTTRDFVLPPQGLLDDDQRPRLTIRLQNGKEYSGILPHAMEVYSSQTGDSNAAGYPVALAFLKEHVLTISTLITEEPPYLVFMPVTVMEWVDKGKFLLEGHQAGIYKEAEFYDMIEQYQQNNDFQLARYGYQATREKDDDTDETIWVFNIWHSLVLDEDKIKGSMVRDKGQDDFEFDFNRYSVSLEDGKPLGTGELKTLVTSQP